MPLEKTLGSRIGRYVMNLHESKGVRFVANAQVVSFSPSLEGDEDVGHVHLNNQDILPADIVVVGIGVESTTDYLDKTSVNLTSAGHVIVNRHMQTNIPNIYAAGKLLYNIVHSIKV